MKRFFVYFAVAAAAPCCFGSVACLGKVVPGERVQSLAASSPTGGQAIIKSLLVKKGDSVKRGDVVALIRGIEGAKVELEGAKASLKIAETSREIKILQQKNMIEDLDGTYAQNARILSEKDPPRREREELEYEQERLARRIDQSKKMLPLVEASEKAVVEDAAVSVERAKARLAEFSVKSPIDGEVVEIHTKEGEAVGNYGICEIADTDSMYVDAEVYVSDVSKIKIGDKAEILSDAMRNEVFSGKVVEISGYVKGNRIFSSDPSDYANTRVVLVKIKLDSPERFRNLIGTQTNVRILNSE